MIKMQKDIFSLLFVAGPQVLDKLITWKYTVKILSRAAEYINYALHALYQLTFIPQGLDSACKKRHSAGTLFKDTHNLANLLVKPVSSNL